MSLNCPKCNASGNNLDWDRELTVSGPIASIKCRVCSYTSPIVVDGRKQLGTDTKSWPNEPYCRWPSLASTLLAKPKLDDSVDAPSASGELAYLLKRNDYPKVGSTPKTKACTECNQRRLKAKELDAAPELIRTKFRDEIRYLDQIRETLEIKYVEKEIINSDKGLSLLFQLEDAATIQRFMQQGEHLDNFNLASDIASIIEAFMQGKLVFK